jgi:hypothetical protein
MLVCEDGYGPKAIQPFKFTSTVKEEKRQKQRNQPHSSSSRGQGKAENKITAELKNNSFRIERSAQQLWS